MKIVSNPKIAVVGCGYWGKNLIRNFSELGALAAVCDASEEQAQKLATEYNVPALTLAQILQDTSISGVVVAAPAAQHFELCVTLLKSNKHVFVEKPLALRVEDAEHIHKLAESHNRILMVGHLLRYHPAFLHLKKIVSEDQLGKIRYIHASRLNLGKIRNEENVLWSFAPHDISMVLNLIDSSPSSVYATGACYLHPHVADVTTIHLRFGSGTQAQISVSWLYPFKEQKLIVVGDKGMAVFDDSLPWEQKLQLHSYQIEYVNGAPTPLRKSAESVPLTLSEPLRLECQHFLTCIGLNQKPETDALEGIHVLQVLEAAEASMKGGAHIKLNLSAPLPFYKHETAIVDEDCTIGAETKIWHFSHILKDTKIGENCIIGQNVAIGPQVTVGDRCKIQNNVTLYKGVTLEDGVFCGPSCVFTNVYNPRAEIERKTEFRETYVEKGVTIGANATILCGVRLGAYSLIGAGAVVLKDVKPHAVMVGNPARQVGWVSHAGEKLGPDLVCSREGRQYQITSENMLQEVFKENKATIISDLKKRVSRE